MSINRLKFMGSAASQRKPDRTAYARIPNLARARVVVT